MNAQEFKNFVLFMANHWDRNTSIEIFGEVMGNHFFDKWASAKDPDLGTMRLFYEMSPSYLQDLISYSICFQEAQEDYEKYLNDHPKEVVKNRMRAYWKNQVKLGKLSEEEANKVISFEEEAFSKG